MDSGEEKERGGRGWGGEGAEAQRSEPLGLLPWMMIKP
jgi:hypothetical protein